MRRVLLIAPGLALLTLLASFAAERLWLLSIQNRVEIDQIPHSASYGKIDLPGITQPRIVPASSAILADDEEILGIELNGHARAIGSKLSPNPPITSSTISSRTSPFP